MNGSFSTKKVIIISFLLLSFFVCLVAPFTFLKPIQNITLNDKNKLVPSITKVKVIKKAIEKPLHDVILPNFSAIIDVKEKKKQFFEFIRPAIASQNAQLLNLRGQLEQLLSRVSLEEPLSDEELNFLNDLSKQYRVSKNYSVLQKLDELLIRVDIVPESLVLVQAANESAWGTSRFSRIGLNFFGIWCYKKGCGMVPSGRNDGAKHEVAAFKSVVANVTHYFKNINTNNAYRVFRVIRSDLREQNQPLNSEILATGLLHYSERGAAYVMDITDMLRHNQRYFN